MIALIRAEAAKLNGSLALLFALAVPALPALLALLALMTNERASAWATIIGQFVMPLWGMFLYPMAAAAFCTLVAQVEYRARAWDNVLATPFPRWQVFAAKQVVVLAALVAMTVLAIAFAYGFAALAGSVTGRMPGGPLGLANSAETALRFLAAAACLSALQMWAALRFANFVAPLAVGIGGTLVGLAVMITGTDNADWFPWLYPLKAMSPAAGDTSVIMGLVGGALVLVMQLVDLSRRSMR